MKYKNVDFAPDGGPETPYQKARQEWDEVIGSARVQARNWRMIGFCTIGVLCLSIMGNIYLATKSAVIPYIVEVREDTGEVVSMGKVSGEKFSPKEASVKSTIAIFIGKIRSVSTDQIVVRQNFLSAYDFVTKKGRNILTNYTQESKIFERIGKKAVSVDKQVITKITENSYQCEWTEKHFNVEGGGGRKSTQHAFTGIFTIICELPKTENKLLVNPLGIYIDEFNISRKY